MERYKVSCQNDLYFLKEVSQKYDEITVDLKVLRFEGLIRHAVKYSMNALVTEGRLIITSSPFETYVLRRDKVDFWQVKYEVFGCLKDTVDIVEVNNTEGRLVLKKKKHLYTYNGISFGIVFSGSDSEEPQLVQAINSIKSNSSLNNFNYEILICGPTNFDPSALIAKLNDENVRYLALDISTSPSIMICEKKNYIYEQASYTLVVISHSRIIFSDNFVDGLIKHPIEMATPAVFFKDEGKDYKYLDFAFIDSYQDMQLGAKRSTVAGENIKDDYLHWYKKKVAFIDGGLNVFNKNVVTTPPYNNYISWGEAEDVDVCNRLFQNGVLIDFLPSIKCYSATCKIIGYKNYLKKVARHLYIHLHKRRIIN